MNDNKVKIVTVADIIASLQKFPMDMPVKIAVGQANKIYPIAYLVPVNMGNNDGYVICQDRTEARIIVNLPWDEEGMMVTKIIKRK